jgi:phytol kinase
VISGELIFNFALFVACYAYIFLTIFLAGRFGSKYSRKFLHMMIGNLVFVIPFFSFNVFPLNFPFFVAFPFVLVTLLVSPYSPIKNISGKMKGLTEITGKGNHTGLVLYAFSYSVLALLFSSRPYVIAIGVLPMAYGDAFASIVGEKIGKTGYSIFAKKSLEGSIAMFTVSFVVVATSLAFTSLLYPLMAYNVLVTALAVAAVATLAEAFSFSGSDNLTVPFFSVLAFLALNGGL